MATDSTASGAAPPWARTTKIAFRFLGTYAVLYILPFPIGAVPGSDLLGKPYEEFWHVVVPWVGQRALGLEITVRPNGSGDTTYNYVQVGILAAVAGAVALLWSLADRRRPHYRRLHGWLRIYVRFYLAIMLLSYAVVKVIPVQFPPPPLDRLLQPYGDSSPMGLLWTFMGAAPAYVIFTGLAELAAGLLIACRRTTLLGALLAAGVMVNVVMLNLCYDVPVKLLSTHLLGLSLFLIVPDLKRLADFFILNRPTHPAPSAPLFGAHVWLNRAAMAGAAIFIGYNVYTLVDEVRADGIRAAKSPLYGIWHVEVFEIDGVPRPPLLTDRERWRRLVFDHPWATTVQLMDGERVRWLVEIDESQGLIKLRFPNQPKRQAQLNFERPNADRLIVRGVYEGRRIIATMSREEASTFVLTSRGFHWINEYPFNR